MPDDRSTLHTHRLANGLTLVAERIPGLRSAAFNLSLPVGSVNDPAGREGAATVLESYVYRGAGERDARTLSDTLDALGVQRAGGTDVELTGFGGACLGDDLLAVLAIYADIVRRPHLRPEDLEAVRSGALQELAALQDNPPGRVAAALWKSYFAGNHGRIPLGTREGLEALDTDNLRADFKRRYSPAGAILGVAGNFEWPRLKAKVEKLFGDWAGEPLALPEPAIAPGTRVGLIQEETNQVQIALAYPAVPPGDPAAYTSLVALYVLDGGSSARLFTEVREKRGLVYAVNATRMAWKGLAAIRAYAGTTPAHAQETLDVIIGEIRQLARGVTPDEFTRAKTGLKSAIILQGESSGARANSIVRDQHLLGRPRSLEEISAAIDRVSREDVDRHVAEHEPREFVVAVIGSQPVEVRA
jgi:predicted Zn-dependent peptidase